MSARRRTLFRYSAPQHATRTLRALRAAYPANTFTVVPEALGWGFNIKATLPNGASGLVKRAPLRTFGTRA